MSNLDDPIDPPPGWQRDHVERYVASDGADGHIWRPGIPTLLLTTLGRRSGQARRTPLIYGRDGDRYLVVASKGGADEQPDWYVNLVANPRVRLQVGAEKFDATAHPADPAEKAHLWPIMTAIWPDYDAYQRRTERDIPVVVLTKV
jgi:deazaflavin-dependent oxidoreductase (nitroreductase family)